MYFIFVSFGFCLVNFQNETFGSLLCTRQTKGEFNKERTHMPESFSFFKESTNATLQLCVEPVESSSILFKMCK